MNTSLRRISVMIMALIVLLLANATLTQVFTADGLRSDPRNQRVLLDEYSRQRGQISAGGQLLAYSVSTEGGSASCACTPIRWPTRRSPASTRCGIRAPGWSAPRTPSSTAPTSGCSGGGWPTSSPAATRAAAMSTPPSIPKCSRRLGTRWRTAATAPCKGAVVALEPSTGKILAMVSAPSYDPNLLATHDVDEQAATWQQLRDDPDNPLLNRAISETYPPGSTFKVITTAAALQAGATENTQLTAAAANPVAGQHRNAGELRRNVVRRRPDRVAARRVREVLQHRVRPARHRHRRGRAEVHRAGVRPGRPLPRRFRFRSPSPPSDRSPTPPPSGCRASGRRTSPLTPLQNAMVAATIANKGVAMRPYLVDSLKGPDLANIGTTAPHEERRAVSQQVADTLTDLDGRRRAGDSAEGSHRRRADRIQDRHSGARHRSAQHPAACLVHRLRARSGTQGRGRGARRERRRPAAATGAPAAAPIAAAADRSRCAPRRRMSTLRRASSSEPPRGCDAVRPLPAAAADRHRRHGPGLGRRRLPAGPPRRDQGAQGRVLRGPRVRRTVPRRGAHRRDAQPSRVSPASTTTARPTWTARAAPPTW